MSEAQRLSTPTLAHANANLLLTLCKPLEPEILLETAWRKQLRSVPDEVVRAAAKRFIRLTKKKRLTLPDDAEASLWTYLYLADLLWNRMTEGDRFAWLNRVK